MTQPVLEMKPYRLALDTPYRWSKGTQHRRTGVIFRLQGPDGLVGWGEAALPPHVDYSPDAFAEEARALVTGLDPLDPQFLAEVELRECPARIRCGISTAVLTWRAAGAGQPLGPESYRVLGSVWLHISIALIVSLLCGGYQHIRLVFAFVALSSILVLYVRHSWFLHFHKLAYLRLVLLWCFSVFYGYRVLMRQWVA